MPRVRFASPRPTSDAPTLAVAPPRIGVNLGATGRAMKILSVSSDSLEQRGPAWNSAWQAEISREAARKEFQHYFEKFVRVRFRYQRVTRHSVLAEDAVSCDPSCWISVEFVVFFDDS